MTITENPYFSGNFAPVREEVTSFDLVVTGTVPEDLDGRLVRIGPNPVVTPDPARFHWFTGDGMVHGVRLRDGRAEWYRNRFVRSDRVAAAMGWPPVPGPRPTDVPDTVNTNIVTIAGRTYAIQEAGALPFELDSHLETVARTDLAGTLSGGFTAHPKLDQATGELHAVSYYFAWDYIRYTVVGTDGRVRRTVDVPLPGRPMVHDMALTETTVVLLDLPVTFDLDAAVAGAPLPYLWDAEYPARVGLLARDGGPGDVVWCEVAPCYVLHVLNAFDEDGIVVLDVIRHEKMFATDRRGPNEGSATLERWRVDPATGKVAEERLDDRGQEFPRCDDRRTGSGYRYGYTCAFSGLDYGPTLKHDLRAAITEDHDYGPGRVSLEPVFVPRSTDAGEDDGWVMSYVYDRSTQRSDVVILAAEDFEGDPVATIHLPARVPFGFHGNWIPTSQ